MQSDPSLDTIDCQFRSNIRDRESEGESDSDYVRIIQSRIGKMLYIVLLNIPYSSGKLPRGLLKQKIFTPLPSLFFQETIIDQVHSHSILPIFFLISHDFIISDKRMLNHSEF